MRDGSRLSDAVVALGQTLHGGWPRFLLLLTAALALHGRALRYGLVYDDAQLLGARHLAWFSGPWDYEQYYRPLQALLFSPWLVSAWPPLLHLENLLAATLAVFLFGRLFQRMGLTPFATMGIELACLTLPTSMMLFVWISQRTDWPTLLAGPALLVLSFSAISDAAFLAIYVLAAAAALLSKETGVAVVAVVPLFTLLYHRRRALGLRLAVAGAALVVGYLALRAHLMPPSPPVPLARALVDLGLQTLEALIYPTIQVCFTYDPRVLGLNAIFLAMATGGALWMWRDARPAALGMFAIFAAYALPAIQLPEPRNLVAPGFVMAALAVFFAHRVVSLGRPKLALAVVTLLIPIFGVLASLSMESSTALQSWVPPLNAQLAVEAKGAVPRGYLYEVDVNTRFRLAMREAVRRCYERWRASRGRLP